MAMAGANTPGRGRDVPFFAAPAVGTVFTILSGLSFLFLCMILPLVGRAGVQTVHVRENDMAFLCAVLVSLALSALATVSKLARRKIDGSPRPLYSVVLLALTLLLLVAQCMGLLRI
jgi:hypothetical protein